MKRQVKRMAIQVLGILCLALGLVGLLLPFIQGLILIAVGVALLSVSTPSVRRRLEQYVDRHPRVEYWHRRAERWILGIVGEL